MFLKFIRRFFLLLLAAALLGGIVYAFLPQPLDVDVATVSRGLLRVTIDEDGKTRVKERYIVSAPLAGRLQRIELRPGDLVEAEKTLLTTIEAGDPQLLDVRAQAEAEARTRATDAAVLRSNAELKRAQEAREQTYHDFQRARKLIDSKTISREEYDKTEHAVRQATQDLHAAEFSVRIAEFEHQQAEAALLRTKPSSEAEHDNSRFEIYSPVGGEVLRVFQESARVVTSGTELIEVGNRADLEAEIDVLSIDAVKMEPGAYVLLEHWGGQQPLSGRVRRIEPAGFTKVSALGVEEQRVNVLVDFVDPPEQRAMLGDGYRVEARIIVWQGEQVLRVPAGALFRDRDQWAVFVIQQDRAVLRPIKIDHHNGLEAEVLSGLDENETVILFPSDKIHDRAQIKIRPSGRQ